MKGGVFLLKRRRKQLIRVIACDNPEQFEHDVNLLHDELINTHYEVEYNINSQIYKALFLIDHVEEIPESAQEELAEQGLSFTCEQCPRFEPARNNDGSVRQTAKKGTCFLSEFTTRESPVCEWFCRQFLKGEIEIIKGGLK